tara:strand:- start:779 stop:1234 length:456 start_codon:yes stop_codon:yes gene_type:complete
MNIFQLAEQLPTEINEYIIDLTYKSMYSDVICQIKTNVNYIISHRLNSSVRFIKSDILLIQFYQYNAATTIYNSDNLPFAAVVQNNSLASSGLKKQLKLGTKNSKYYLHYIDDSNYRTSENYTFKNASHIPFGDKIQKLHKMIYIVKSEMD